MRIHWAALALVLTRECAEGFTTARVGSSFLFGAPRSRCLETTTSAIGLVDGVLDLDDKEHLDSPFSSGITIDPSSTASSTSSNFTERNKQWLEQGTQDVLDFDKFPLGSLSPEDVETIAGIMTAWARRKSVDAALVVEKLLKRVVDDLRAGNKSICVTTRLYTMAMDAWAKSGQQGVAQRAQHIHDAMIDMYKKSGDEAIAPSRISYNTLMNAWTKTGHPDEAFKMAELIFDDMISAYKDNGKKGLKPDAVTFSTLMDAYAKCQEPHGTQRAQELFDMMDEFGIKKNVYSYSALQVAYARSSAPGAVDKALSVLHKMLETYEKEGDVLAKPNVINFNAVLNACSRSPDREAPERAETMLRKMELDVSEGGYDVEPDRLSYALAIFAAAKSRDAIKGAERAEALLERMEARSLEEEERRKEISSAAPASVELDIESFNCVLRRLGQIGAQDRALAIVNRMEQYADEGRESVRPNVRSWNMVLNALSRSRAKGSAKRAHDLLDRMHKMYDTGQSTAKPDIYSYSAVLTAYQRAIEPQKGDSLVRQMEELYEEGKIDSPPDVIHYTIVCSTWAKSGAKVAASRCAQILSHMIQRHQEGYTDAKPNTRTYNAVIDCLSLARHPEKAEQLLFYMLSLYRKGDTEAGPDAYSFNAVIGAWARMKTRGAGKRSEAILERLIEYSEDENPQVRPDTRSFNHIIGYYRFTKDKTPDAPYRAEYLLNRMVVLCEKSGYKGLLPNTFSFVSAMDVFAYGKNPDAGDAAERLLKLLNRLREEYGAPDLETDWRVMNGVIHAWSLSGHADAGERAEMHLEDMEEQYEMGVEKMKPNTRTYGLVLSALSRSEKPDKLQRALNVLRRMEAQRRQGNESVELNEHAYALVINACAYTNGTIKEQRNAFWIAVSIFDQIVASKEIQLTSLTYGWFIEATGRLQIPRDVRDDHVEKAFRLCRENGRVNNFVLDRLRTSASSDLYNHLLAPALDNRKDKGEVKKPRVVTTQLPREWSKNRNRRGPQWTESTRMR